MQRLGKGPTVGSSMYVSAPSLTSPPLKAEVSIKSIDTEVLSLQEESRVGTGEDWRAAHQETSKPEIAGVAEKLLSCHSSLTRKPAWWEMKGQEGERKVRGRKVNPELLLHVSSCLLNSSLTLLSPLYPSPQHSSQEPQAPVTLESLPTQQRAHL